MTAQIERSPRQCVELDQAWTWKDYVAMSVSNGLIYACLAPMVLWPSPETVFWGTLGACIVLIVAFVVSAACEPGAHL